jgi:hypothetical protein
MSEENKAIVQRFFEEIWNEGNLEIANEIIDDGYSQTDLTTGPRHIAGPAILQHEVDAYRSVTDDRHFDVEEIIAEWDKVVAHWEATCTLGDEPESPGPVRGVSIHHIVDGKVAGISLYSLAFVDNTAWLLGIFATDHHP